MAYLHLATLVFSNLYKNFRVEQMQEVLICYFVRCEYRLIMSVD